MQGKLFQRCTYLLYCSVLSLGGNVNTRRMAQPDMGSIFHIKNQWNILVIGNYCVNHHNYQNLILLTSSDTRRTLMNLFLFTNSAQKELVSICIQYTTAINFLCIITLVVALFLDPSLILSFHSLNRKLIDLTFFQSLLLLTETTLTLRNENKLLRKKNV